MKSIFSYVRGQVNLKPFMLCQFMLLVQEKASSQPPFYCSGESHNKKHILLFIPRLFCAFNPQASLPEDTV